MAQCFEIIGGQLQAVAVTSSECLGYLLLDAVEYAQLSTAGEITPEAIAYIWAWGFGSIVTPWATAYAIMWVKKTIQLA